jgi:hypothetical protein
MSVPLDPNTTEESEERVDQGTMDQTLKRNCEILGKVIEDSLGCAKKLLAPAIKEVEKKNYTVNMYWQKIC